MSKLEENSADLLERLNHMIDAAFSEGAEHAPDIVNGVLFTASVSYILQALFCLLVIAAAGAWWLQAYRSNWYDEEFAFFASVVIALFATGGLLASIYSLAKVHFAPKVYLLEYAAALIS